jgi:antitoxin MazE
MRAKIVRIGNSRGVRIPRALLERSGLGDEVELEADEHRIVIRAVRQPREGWSDAFRAMRSESDDVLVHGDTSGQSTFDEDDWTW